MAASQVTTRSHRASRAIGTRRAACHAGLVLATALLVAGCGGATGSAAPAATPSQPSAPQPSTAPASPSTPSTPTAAPPASPSATPTSAPSKGPATAAVSLTGSGGLTGSITTSSITCGLPSLDGSQIEVLGKAASGGPDIVLFVTDGHVEARVGQGSGPQLKLRTFVGSGVTGFDAHTGATIDSALTEITASGTAIGTLGALTRIAGTFDCGDQQTGSSTVAITGAAVQGQMTGALTSARVECTVTASGTFVGIRALGMAGTTPVLVFVTASKGLLEVAVETKAQGDFYTAKRDGLVTLTPDGAQIAGDVTEVVKAGATPHTLHAEGSATCGSTVQR